MTGLTNAYVYPGGAVIDDGGFAITIAQPLIAPTGGGVSATGLTVASSSGFIDTPIVQISGDGSGAMGVATVDYSTGKLTGITITNPGNGYTSSATITLVGGGVGSTATFTYPNTGGTSMAIVANTSGGLTKLGSGTLTLTATNTYAGNTTINNGTLLAAITASLPNYATSGKIVVNTGGTIAVNYDGVSDWIASNVNTLNNSAAFSLGSFLGFDTTNATGSITYSNAIGGIKGLKKLGTNSLVLDVTETYTGATVINNGILELASTGQINTASAISTSAVTATFQVNGGTHTVGTISGVGKTNILAGGTLTTLTATSISQGALIIGGTPIAALQGGPQAGMGSISPVPEPSTWAMLLLAAMGLGIYRRRSR